MQSSGAKFYDTYISSSFTQLPIYSQFLRANYKEVGLKSTLLLVAILKLFVSLNTMAGNSVGVEDCKIHVHDSSLQSTSSQINIESSLDILSTIQRATRTVVQIYYELFSLFKNDLWKHNLKEKLIKDIYTFFAFVVKPSDLANAETQTDEVFDLNQTYAKESELDTVKQMFLDEISNLKECNNPQLQYDDIRFFQV